MLHVFDLWNHEGEMLPLKPFKSMGNDGKRALHVRIFFGKFDTGYTSMTRITYSLNWCKCL